MRGFAFVKLPSLAPSVTFLVDRAQDVDGAIHAAELIERLVHAVLACVRAQPVCWRAYEPSRCRINDGDAVRA